MSFLSGSKRGLLALQSLTGVSSLTSDELLIWLQGFDSADAEADLQSTIITVPDIPANSIFLLPTIAVSNIWDTSDPFTFAVFLMTGAEPNISGKIVRQFKVVGHLDSPVLGDAFLTVGASFSVLEKAPASFITVPSTLVSALWTQFNIGKSVVSSEGTQSSLLADKKSRIALPSSSPSGKLSSASSILFTDGDNPENSSTEGKVVVDPDGVPWHIQSQFAMKIMKERQVFMRGMHPTRISMFLRNDVGYDRSVWNAAISPYAQGRSAISDDLQSQAIARCYRLVRMEVCNPPERLDDARRCLWTENDWSKLSIIHFNPNPHGGSSMFEGNDPMVLDYLRDCVMGFRLFLSVYYTAEAASFFQSLVDWFHDQKIHRTKRFDGEFLRARIDRMLVNFWSEVRHNGPQSPQYPRFSYATPGDIWKILAAYEKDLVDGFLDDPFPHSLFYCTPDGEYCMISGSTTHARSVPVSRSVSAHSSPPPASKPQAKTSSSICPYHLFHLLQVAKADGTTCAACTRGSSCGLPHVSLNVISFSQALEAAVSAKVSDKTLASASSRISSDPSVFKP